MKAIAKIQWIKSQHESIKQKYDDYIDYEFHLSAVHEVGARYKYLIPEEDWNDVSVALWGHDVYEDIEGITKKTLINNVGERPTEIILSVSKIGESKEQYYQDYTSGRRRVR